jgi:nicotinamide-nucleotide amidase
MKDGIEKYVRVTPLDYAEVYKNLVGGIKSYCEKNHIKALVLGISGGIDSTVCAALCKQVDLPLIGVSLPCSTNGTDEVSSATLTGNEFCTTFEEINLEGVYETVEDFCRGTLHSIDATPISRGNIKARLRMITLYDIASRVGGIVVDTDNLTEHFLGFWTLHGDDGDFNPIGCLWKHEVYGLAKWMKENVYKDSKALEAAIAIMPTDGNGVKAGGDLAQIAPGKTYDDVDDILYHWVNLSDKIKPLYAADDLTESIKNTQFDNENEDVKQRRMEACQKSGKEFVPTLGDKYGIDTVRGVCMRSWRSEFKRKQRPFTIDPFKGIILEKNGNIF